MRRLIWSLGALCVLVAVGLFALTSQRKDQTLTFEGLGPVRIGMTLPEVEAALGTKLKSVYPDMPANCWFGNRADGVDGPISYWVENGKIVRIDVDRYAWPNPEKVLLGVKTERGIQIDSSPDDVRQAYGATLVVDHRSNGGENDFYMTVLSDDKWYGLAFTTSEGKVDAFMAGTAENFYIMEPCDY